MNYINYYNGENCMYSFTFEGFSKEEATRIQAYLLQDNPLFINDEEVLNKINESPKEIFKCEAYTEGEIYIKKALDSEDHYILFGYCKTVNNQLEKEYNMSCNIYEGMNFIAFVSLLESRGIYSCQTSTFSWVYEPKVNPNKLTRYDSRKVGGMLLDETLSEDYEVSENFNIRDNPVAIFTNNKKETKVKKK